MATFVYNALGCGSAKPSVRHNPSATALDIRGTLHLIDCGEGAQKQMQVMGLKFSRLRHIYLTHLHGDHILGLPGLIETLNLIGCGGTVTVHTFAKGIKFIRKMREFFGYQLNYTLEFQELNPEREEVVTDTDSLRVTSLPLRHRVPTVGYLFEEKPKPRHLIRDMVEFHQVPFSLRRRLQCGEDFVRPDGTVIPNAMLTREPSPSVSYGHISDTAYMPELGERIRGVDTLLHEATYLESERQEAMERGHSTAREAALTACSAQARRLILTHYSSRYKREEDLLEEAREVFPSTILGYEGLRVGLD